MYGWVYLCVYISVCICLCVYVCVCMYVCVCLSVYVFCVAHGRGMDAIVNDSLIGSVLMAGCVFLSVFFGAVGALVATLWKTDPLGSFLLDLVVFVMVGLLMGLAVGSQVGCIVDSAVSMLFVCFAKSPEFLKVGLCLSVSRQSKDYSPADMSPTSSSLHPVCLRCSLPSSQRFDKDEYDRLLFSWREFHPESLEAIAPAEAVLFDQAEPPTYQEHPNSYQNGGGAARGSLAMARPVAGDYDF